VTALGLALCAAALGVQLAAVLRLRGPEAASAPTGAPEGPEAASGPHSLAGGA
jgi:hypothetical protein